MDTFKIYKEYDQVKHLEDQDPIKTLNPNSKPYFTISLIFISLFLASIIVFLVFHSRTESQLAPNSSDSNSIELVCKVTQYYDSCLSTLTSANTRPDPNPEFLFSLSLNSSINEMSKLASDSLNYRVTESRTRSALEDCRSLFADGIEQLEMSAARVRKGHVASSAGVEISDVNTWISAAMTDLETCVDGLEEVESTVVDEIRGKVHGSNVCVSNSLAILVNIKNLTEKFHHLHSDHV